uniref:PDZ domain-containing protein n=1 Tax=Calcidiscus leptoporus TaxID=127549 RepID=A0A7S0IYJ3_9EUKA|mmetsp:Transcript_2992/g.6787  ORF Transcript_2992/g.6787 Transcript_2992/m.6787 type:complete len:449 (+) Transcript_2992:193-1539(+)
MFVAAAPATNSKKMAEVRVTVHRTDKGFGIVLMSSEGNALIDGTSANARDAGLQKGDYVISVNGEELTTYPSVFEAIKKSRGSLELTVLREQKEGWGLFTSSVMDAFASNLFGTGKLSDAEFEELFAAQQHSDMALLMHAVNDGQLEEVRDLLLPGTDVNVPNSVGDTPLILASWQGNSDICRLLLRHGADVDIANAEGNSALSCASYRGHLEVVKLLIEQSAPLEHVDHMTGKTPLIKACYKGHAETAEVLLNAGADKNATDSKGYSALAFAVSFDRADVVAVLLRAGADANQQDVFGITPLIHAAARGHTDQVRMLLNAGAVPSSLDGDDRCALDYAESAGHLEIISLLTRQGLEGKPARPPTADAGGGAMTPRLTPRAVVANQGSITPRVPHLQPSASAPTKVTAEALAKLDSAALQRLSWQLVQVARTLAKRDTSTDDVQYPTF